jgi:hypothetical protein
LQDFFGGLAPGHHSQCDSVPVQRTEDGEIDFYNETLWDDVTQDVLRPSDEGHVRLAERYLIDIDEIQGVAEQKKILASTDAQEKVKLQVMRRNVPLRLA